MESDCLLCAKYPLKIFESVHFFTVYDDFPVREGHMLIVPIRHVEHITDLMYEEFCDLYVVIAEMVRIVKRDFGADGYNLGVNGGEAAGQTHPHVHIHIIPRYRGDVPDPRGGIRKFLPNPLTEYPKGA